MSSGKVNYSNALSLVQQIVTTISLDIEKGTYKKNERLLSINIYAKRFGVARDTIEKAYIRLREAGYITSVKGKGYFVTGKSAEKINVLLIFNKLSSYKKIVYDAILDTLGDKAKVDIQIHHYNPTLLEDIIDTNLGSYHYYVVMPMFTKDVSEKTIVRLLKKIPESQLVLLDKALPGIQAKHAVFQDYRNDIYQALSLNADHLNKYDKLIMIFPPDRNYQDAIQDGLKQFGEEYGKATEIIPDQKNRTPKKGEVYVAITEDDLVMLIKKTKQTDLKLGQDIGIISYNDTPFKELLDITVLTTDFEEMGKTTASIILNNQEANIRNPFQIIIRNSL